MHRAARRVRIGDRRAVRLLREQDRQDDRPGHDERARERARGEGYEAPRDAAARPPGSEPMRRDRAREKQEAEEGDLIAVQGHQAGGEAGERAVEEGVARQGPRQEEQRHRPEGEAQDLADMLHPPAGRHAEGEDEGRGERPGRMPGTVAGVGHDRERAEPEHAEDGGVEGAKARIGIEGREGEEGRREDQGLRIGDLRRAGEDVGRPERLLAAMQRLRQELQLRIKMRLRVPGDRDRAGEPGPAQDRPAEEKERDRRRPVAAGRRGRSGQAHAATPGARGRAGPRPARVSSGSERARRGSRNR